MRGTTSPAPPSRCAAGSCTVRCRGRRPTRPAMERDDLDPPFPAVQEAVARALAEDLLPLGDLTGGLVPSTTLRRAAFVARADGVVAGTACASEACRQVDARLSVEWAVHDGGAVEAGTVVGNVDGRLRSILVA